MLLKLILLFAEIHVFILYAGVVVSGLPYMLYRSICRQIKTKIKDWGMCNLLCFCLKVGFFFLFIEIHLFVSRGKINNFVGFSCNTKRVVPESFIKIMDRTWTCFMVVFGRLDYKFLF